MVQCHEVGVSDTPGIAAMTKPAGNTGHARISNRECRMTNVEGDSSFDIRHSTFITLTTLDDFCSARGLERLDAILLDVEGFEDRALKGAAKTLDRFRPLVVVESLWPPAMQQQGTSVEAVADVLEKHDYRLFAPHRRQLLPLAELPRGDSGVYAFCFHKDRVPARWPAI